MPHTFSCPICLDERADAFSTVTLQCGHAFGTRCIADWCRHRSGRQAQPSPVRGPAGPKFAGPPCPLCRCDISPSDRIKIAVDDAKQIETHISDVTCDTEKLHLSDEFWRAVPAVLGIECLRGTAYLMQ